MIMALVFVGVAWIRYPVNVILKYKLFIQDNI
jgi:hypothetical protein